MNNKEGSDTQSHREDAGILPVPADLGQEGLPVPPDKGTDEGLGETPVEEEGPEARSDSSSETARFSQDVHSYLREFIRLADQKAAFFFAGGTALLAFLYNNGAVDRWWKPVMQWTVVDVLAFVAVLALIVSVLLSVWVVIPRTGGSRRGIVFWEAIQEYSSGREYADDVARMSIASLTRARAEHCYDLAAVCKRKYYVLRVALQVGAVGLAASLILLLVL